MPRFDKTGSQGQGPMTGRGLGLCGDGSGMGMGMGMGRGRRFGCGFGRGLGRYFGWNAPQTDEDKIEELQTYLTALKEEVEDVNKELTDLQK